MSEPGTSGQVLTPEFGEIGGMSDWKSHLRPAEQEVLDEVHSWAAQSSGPLGRAVLLAGRPFEKAFDAVPGSFRESLAQGIHQALLAVRSASEATFSRQGVLDRISARIGLDVGTEPEQIFRADVRDLDRFARDSLTFHRRAAAMQGAAAGVSGLFGLLADVPVLYTLLYRCILEMAICYGFPVQGAAEEAHMLKILDLGHFLEDDRRRLGLAELEGLQDMIREGVPLKDLERLVLAKGLQAFSRHLAAGLMRRKAAQAVVLVGGLVGAGVNHQLLADVGTVAWQAYRRRFVMELAHRRLARATRALVDAPAVVPGDGTSPEVIPEDQV
jgi:hypothetical protein